MGVLLPPGVTWADIADDIARQLGSHTPPAHSVVPDLQGCSIDEARLLAFRAGFRLDSRPDSEHPPPVEGVIVEQAPAAGRKLRRDGHIQVVLHFESGTPGTVPDYYAILGVTRNASAAEIHEAWRKGALVVHPDRGGDQRAFLQLAVAYEILADPTRRNAYDRYVTNMSVTDQ